MSQKSPPSYFKIFSNKLDFKKPKESSLLRFLKLCAFWALDIAPILDVPVLFLISPPNVEIWKDSVNKNLSAAFQLWKDVITKKFKANIILVLGVSLASVPTPKYASPNFELFNYLEILNAQWGYFN